IPPRRLEVAPRRTRIDDAKELACRPGQLPAPRASACLACEKELATPPAPRYLALLPGPSAPRLCWRVAASAAPATLHRPWAPHYPAIESNPRAAVAGVPWPPG